MELAIQLALTTKAKKVFGNDHTFLSLPITPLPFAKQKLSFLSDQNLQNLQEFSSLVNLIPNGEVWQPTETRYLWDVYDEILREATFASSTRTSEEDAKYQDAIRYLRVTKEDGTWEETETVKTYKRYKDAFLLAQQKYLADKNTAECSTNLADRQRWQEIDEPNLRTQLKVLEEQWLLEGYKDQVETAQNLMLNLGAKSPIQTWSEWRELFNPALDTLTSAIDQSVAYSSAFSPSNALDDGAWQPFKLTRDEVKALIEESPAELRSRLSPSSDLSLLPSLEFEFSSAAIVRPWFSSDVFKARFWDFPDSSKVLSDGNIPPAGQCTAYVTAIVFARNLRVKADRPSWENTSNSNYDAYPYAWSTEGSTASTSNAQPSPSVPVSSFSSSNAARMVPMYRSVSSQQEIDLAFRQLQNTTVRRLPTTQDNEAANESSPFPQKPDTSNTIYILAFICKRIPQCPDPDPTLQWG
jgi:hypothetical protein